MRVANNAQRGQFGPGDIAASLLQRPAPSLGSGPGFDPKRVLVQVVAPQEQVRHILQNVCILLNGVGRARGFQRNHRANSIRGAQGCRQSEVATLAVGEENGASLEALEQGIVSSLRRKVVATPARNTLAVKILEMIGWKPRTGMGTAFCWIG